MVAYVIIPGFDGSDEQRWQTLWERQWGASAVRISPASWSAPRPGRLGRRRPGRRTKTPPSKTVTSPWRRTAWAAGRRPPG
ncbi:alpha/beta hydrolase [Streptomyces nigra]|uniref:alpha/beta hydrolase n=1 Tax=Streptomyces nigra TaxID=1827580 RepID=UPI003653991B